MGSGHSSVADYLPHFPKVKVSSPAFDTVTEGEIMAGTSLLFLFPVPVAPGSEPLNSGLLVSCSTTALLCSFLLIKNNLASFDETAN